MMRSILRAAVAVTALPAFAAPLAAMPVMSMSPPALTTVQWLPPGYPYDPCAPGAPPLRIAKTDDWGRRFVAVEPAHNYCREARGETYLLPPPPPAALVLVPPSGYDAHGRPLYRWYLVPRR